MEKRSKLKVGLSVGFVVICGIVCLLFRGEWYTWDRIVLEQSEMITPESNRLMNEAEQDTQGNQTTEAEEIPVIDGTQQKVQLLCVHMCGAVVTEGVYYVPVGSRVTDGIAAAGGFSETADTTYHNLAATLTDGQKVYVPTREETEEVTVEERVSDTETGTAVSKGSQESLANRKVNLNTASLAELMTLSGIGEAKAKSIMEYREKVGPFGRIEEIKNISGIGNAMFDRIKEDITVE